ncbi:MAG TPA: hypothetical protein VE201_06285 [Nitrospirales bacterium]|nr:hypothetical protein [Nitrospirales bacterium]
MPRQFVLSIAVSLGLVLCVSVAFAEPPSTMSPLRDLPQDVQVKIAQLARILAGAIQSGRLSDAQVKAALNGGDAPTMIRSLGPEAAQLLQDIAAGFKGRYTEEELNIILSGLIESK